VPGRSASDQTCNWLANAYIPIGKTIEATVGGLLDSAHLKPGKEIWVNSIYEEIDPECRLDEKAAIYGHVTAVSSSKDPQASELSLQFDRADCRGHARQQIKLSLIGVVAPPDEQETVHSVLPTRGDGRVDSGWGFDEKLNPGGPPKSVRPGAVLGFKALKLDPQGGPECGARLTSSNRNIKLGPGTVLLLVEPDTVH